jgi:peptidoglycan/LPS O-acetylase OafA/YrhL
MTRQTARSDALDGLRGFAALAVLFAHFVVFMGLLPYTPMGAMGVVMFFALSGYLIAGICWRTNGGLADYRRFLVRRIVRLVPVLLGLVVVGGPLLVIWGGKPANVVALDSLIVLGQGTAFAAVSGVDVLEVFMPTWSLSVEWCFYLVFPVILMLLRRRRLDPTTVTRTLAVLAAGLYAFGLTLPALAFYLLPVANLGVLFAGAAMATSHHIGQPRRHRTDPAYGWVSLVMLCILVVLPGHPLGWAWKLAVLPAAALCTLVVIHACTSRIGPTRVFASGPLRHVGLRAYSLYVWHVPIMWLVWVNMPRSSAGSRAVVAAVAIAAVVVVSFELFERPVLSGSGRSKPKVAPPRLPVTTQPEPTSHPPGGEGPPMARNDLGFDC